MRGRRLLARFLERALQDWPLRIQHCGCIAKPPVNFLSFLDFSCDLPVPAMHSKRRPLCLARCCSATGVPAGEIEPRRYPGEQEADGRPLGGSQVCGSEWQASGLMCPHVHLPHYSAEGRTCLSRPSATAGSPGVVRTIRIAQRPSASSLS
jgi:hypothetical protein